MVDSSRTHGSPDNIGVALMGARGLGNLTSLFEDGEESEEEKRQREARNAGSVAGALVGGALGAVIELSKPKPTPAEDVDIDEDENQGFEITM